MDDVISNLTKANTKCRHQQGFKHIYVQDAHTHTHTHARTHARTHAHIHTHSTLITSRVPCTTLFQVLSQRNRWLEISCFKLVSGNRRLWCERNLATDSLISLTSWHHHVVVSLLASVPPPPPPPHPPHTHTQPTLTSSALQFRSQRGVKKFQWLYKQLSVGRKQNLQLEWLLALWNKI